MKQTVSPVGRTGVEIIDQTLLPGIEKYIVISKLQDAYDAIKSLQVRGAPAIGVFAALIMAVLADKIDTDDYDVFVQEFNEKKDYLNSSRPTAVNLSWALKEMEKVVSSDTNVSSIKDKLFERAKEIMEADIASSKTIGNLGADLIKPGYGILTHCNAGALATVEYGTATAPMYIAKERGVEGLRVFCDETRPLLQGARLTAYELNKAGFDVTVLCDNMAAALMKSGQIDIIFVGADRIAKNGDVANKIGTSSLAINAKRYGIPFYVCAPRSTFDENTKTGADIVIEQRDGAEVTDMWYREPMAPSGVKVYNPAFDVTDNELITGIIFEDGIQTIF